MTQPSESLFLIQRAGRIKCDLKTIADVGRISINLITSEEATLVSGEQLHWITSMLHVDSFDVTSLDQRIRDQVRVEGLGKYWIVAHEEDSIELAAELRELHSLPGMTVADSKRFLDKSEMKRLLRDHGLTCFPKHRLVDPSLPGSEDDLASEIVEELGNELFAKPIVGTRSESSRSIVGRGELSSWLRNLKLSDPGRIYEVDEFVRGELVTYDTIVRDNRASVWWAGLDAAPNAEFQLGRPMGSVVLDWRSDLAMRIRRRGDECMEALGPIPNGPTHMEFLLTSDGNLIFLEMAVRAPGGLAPEVFESMSGINPQLDFYLSQTGRAPQIAPTYGPPFIAWLWYPEKAGEVIGLKELPQEIPSLARTTLLVEPGTRLSGALDNRSKVAEVWLQHDDPEMVLCDFKKLRDIEIVEYRSL